MLVSFPPSNLTSKSNVCIESGKQSVAFRRIYCQLGGEMPQASFVRIFLRSSRITKTLDSWWNTRFDQRNRRFRKRWRRPQILQFCGDDRRIRQEPRPNQDMHTPYKSIVPAQLQDLRPSPSFTKSSIGRLSITDRKGMAVKNVQNGNQTFQRLPSSSLSKPVRIPISNKQVSCCVNKIVCFVPSQGSLLS